MATETTEKKDESKPKIETEPHVLRLAKAMNMSMENLLPPDEDLSKKTEAELEKDKKVEETPEQKKAREDSAAAATAAKLPEAAPMRPVVVVKREEKKPEVDETKKRELDAEAEYVKSLTEDQQYEVELARFAEKNGKPGQLKKLLDYYHSAEKFLTDNPELEPTSSEFVEFMEKNEPKLSNAERRKLERAIITQSATQNARDEVTKEFEPVVRELNEMKSAPSIKAVVDDARAIMTKKTEGDDISISQEVFDKVQSMPYHQAVEEFPQEAPIIASTIAKVREWTRIWNSVVEVDLKDPNHQWLMNFLQNKEAEMLSKPESYQVRDGKRFVPITKFIELEQTNPKAAAGCWTFQHKDVASMIAENGALYHKAQVKKLINAGWTRNTSDKKSPASEVEKKAESDKTSTSGSPKAVGHTMTGAGSTADKPNFDDMPPHLRNLAKVMNTSS